MKKTNITLWLAALLVLLCALQVLNNKYFYNENITETAENEKETETGGEEYNTDEEYNADEVNEITKYNEEKASKQAEETKKGIETAKGDIYGNTSYMFNNSAAFMERLKTEVNNMANDKSDNDHLYDVAESIRINTINYYSILNGCYEDGNEELVNTCKAYVFNVEILAYNMMQFIKQGRTEYISRAMICIAAEGDCTSNFKNAEKEYLAKHTANELPTTQAQP